MGTIYGARSRRKVIVCESDAGSGLGTDVSWRISASGIVDVTGTVAGVAYPRANVRGKCLARGRARIINLCDILNLKQARSKR